MSQDLFFSCSEKNKDVVGVRVCGLKCKIELTDAFCFDGASTEIYFVSSSFYSPFRVIFLHFSVVA